MERRGEVGGEGSGDVPGERERGDSERRKRDVAALLRLFTVGAGESSSTDERGEEDEEVESVGEPGARLANAAWSRGSDACRLGSTAASVEGSEGRAGCETVAERDRSAER